MSRKIEGAKSNGSRLSGQRFELTVNFAEAMGPNNLVSAVSRNGVNHTEDHSLSARLAAVHDLKASVEIRVDGKPISQ